MKKFFIPVMALTALTAFAGTRELQESSPEVKKNLNGERLAEMLSKGQSITALPLKITPPYSEGLTPSAAAVSRAEAMKIDTTAYYQTPAATFYSVFRFSNSEGRSYTLPNAALVPAYTKNTWYNMSYAPQYYYQYDMYMAAQVSGKTMKWEQLDSEGEVLNQSAKENFTYQRPASAYRGFGYNSPVLTVNGKSVYQMGETYNDEVEPTFFEYGGRGEANPIFSEEIQAELASIVGPISDFRQPGLLPFNRACDEFITTFDGGAFDYDVNSENGPLETWWTTQKEVPEDFKVVALGQWITKPTTPYALRSITMDAIVNCEAGALLHFSFFNVALDGEVNLAKPDHSYDYVFPEAVKGDHVDIVVPFKLLDSTGEELDYALIDHSMIMVVSGYNDEKFTRFNPIIAAFKYDRDYLTLSNASQDCLALVREETDGKVKFGLASTPYLCGFYPAGSNELVYGTYNSMNLFFDVEYPYLRAYELYRDEMMSTQYGDGERKCSLGLTTESPEATLVALCPGQAEDILVETSTGDDVPAWLDVEIVNAPEREGEDEGQKYVYIDLKLVGDDASVKSAPLKLTYLGQELYVTVSTDPAGIDAIEAGASAELDWDAPVYNVMGRKVNRDYKGVAIQNGHKFVVK